MQDSAHTRNKDVESRLRPASFSAYPSLADTMKDYSRSVHEQPGSSTTVPSRFHQEGLSQGMASGPRSDYIGFNSSYDQPNRAAPMEFRAPIMLSISHESILSDSQRSCIAPQTTNSTLTKPTETNLARNSRAYLGRLDDMPSATDFQAANALGQEQ